MPLLHSYYTVIWSCHNNLIDPYENCCQLLPLYSKNLKPDFPFPSELEIVNKHFGEPPPPSHGVSNILSRNHHMFQRTSDSACFPPAIRSHARTGHGISLRFFAERKEQRKQYGHCKKIAFLRVFINGLGPNSEAGKEDRQVFCMKPQLDSAFIRVCLRCGQQARLLWSLIRGVLYSERKEGKKPEAAAWTLCMFAMWTTGWINNYCRVKPHP